MDPSRTQTGGFGKGKASAFAATGNAQNAGLDMGNAKARQKNLQHTIDVEEDQATSVADNVSAGGTRYIVGLKGGLKFYGQGSSQHDLQESMSQLSKSRGNPADGDFVDYASGSGDGNGSLGRASGKQFRTIQDAGGGKQQVLMDFDQQSVGSIR